MTPDYEEERIALSFKRFAQQFLVDEGLFFDVDVAVRQEIFGQRLFQLRANILTDDLPPETLTQRTRITHEIPASTWQMWKKRHARRWYARRLVACWPVRYGPDPDGRGTDAVCTFDLERYRTYPRARVALPEQFGRPVYVHAIRDMRWNEETP
ncbi:hypothetical protein [Streptomyces sp. LUP30]|uniref:hypothetical protein n=1 Tax=Streptomyces sp. LUP30 TaxID=1890285 RepID=UPI00085182EC|nr:hypothetical protein [Streptomyces sp. LUP30]